MMDSFGMEGLRKFSPEPFLGIGDLDEATESEGEDKADNSASVQNPNKDDPRRLFQVYEPEFMWDPSTPYDQLPTRLEENGPTPLIYPDHFYEVLGGIVIIYWEKDRSTPIICSVTKIYE